MKYTLIFKNTLNIFCPLLNFVIFLEMQNSFFKYFFLLFLLGILLSNLVFAEETVYPYTFQQDTTLVGHVVADGNFFSNDSLTFVSIRNTFKNENLPPSLIFYDENYAED